MQFSFVHKLFIRFSSEDQFQNIVASLIRQDPHIIVLFYFLMVIDGQKNSGVGPGQPKNDETFIGVCSRVRTQTYFETSLLATRMWQRTAALTLGMLSRSLEQFPT